MILHAFGDSFVVGDQDDFLEENSNVTHNMKRDVRTEYLKNNVSFISLISQHYEITQKNYAICGASNFSQLDMLVGKLFRDEIKSDDVIFFGLTTAVRDRFNLVLTAPPKAYYPLIDSSLVDSDDMGILPRVDLLYILCILEQLSTIYNVQIIKFNLFGNSMFGCEEAKKFTNYIEHTLIDIINDTVGKNVNLHPFDNNSVPNGYQHFYTHNRHPSIEGHKKIADWFINNIKFNGSSF
jgi:hypothetical protein